MYIGLKKLAVVPVTYREKIRVGIGHIYKIRCISTINKFRFQTQTFRSCAVA